MKSVIKGLLWLLDKNHRSNNVISEDNSKKFTHIIDTNFKSDYGTATQAVRTVPYPVWKLKTETKELLAADKHRVMNDKYQPVWVQDLKAGDKVITENGVETVTDVVDMGMKVHMYCLSINTDEQHSSLIDNTFFTDGILSHNTTVAAGYLLWKAMFNRDVTLLICANKYSQALEIMERIRYAYENIPDYIRAGVKEYNKGTIAFDNGSRILSRATTPDAGRGLSISLLYCLGEHTNLTVRDKVTGEVSNVSIKDMYEEFS